MLDSHCHFWSLARGDYGWLDPNNRDLVPLCRDFSPPDYPDTAALLAVQAAPSFAETQYLLELAERFSQIKGVIGWLDLTDAAHVTAVLAAKPAKLVGIRPMLQDISQTDWLLEAVKPDVIAEVSAAGLCFDALITTRHLPMLDTFCAAFPGVSVIVDHAAKPPASRHEFVQWQAGIKRLARHPQVSCKLSGLMTEIAHPASPMAELHAIFETLLESFGPKRLLWGSDWPVLTLAARYQDWLIVTERLLETLSSDDRAIIMGGNAARIYGISV